MSQKIASMTPSVLYPHKGCLNFLMMFADPLADKATGTDKYVRLDNKVMRTWMSLGQRSAVVTPLLSSEIYWREARVHNLY